MIFNKSFKSTVIPDNDPIIKFIEVLKSLYKQVDKYPVDLSVFDYSKFSKFKESVFNDALSDSLWDAENTLRKYYVDFISEIPNLYKLRYYINSGNGLYVYYMNNSTTMVEDLKTLISRTIEDLNNMVKRS